MMGDAVMPKLTPKLVAGLALSVALALPTIAAAQAPSPPSLGKVRIGLPSGTPDGGRMRQGTWAPIYISLTAGPSGNGQQQFKVVLDAVDAEDNPYRYSVPVPAMIAGVTEVVIGYLRAPNQEISVSLQTVDGKTLQGPIKHLRSTEAEPVPPMMPLFVVLGGAKMPRLKAALLAEPAKQGEVADETVESAFAKAHTLISKVEDMPDRWFGYDAADVVILTTDSDTFMKDLTSAQAAPRRKALAEWVRRGGRLVISVGRNDQMVESLLRGMPLPEVDQMRLVPFEVTGSVQRKTLRSVNIFAHDLGNWPVLGEDSKNGVEVATLALSPERKETSGLGIGVNVLLDEPPLPGDKDSQTRPLLVESSCGLGRVLVITFDVDAAPFNEWKGQKDFWIRVRDLVGGINPNEIKKALNNVSGPDAPELKTEFEKYIDTFDDVPVVSFGWVAAFIFIYIIVVGPLDYFVLKKVFKRLELTWVTFPTVVLTISVGAYFIAYALKGEDLRVNKVDLVEIDLHTPQAYGTSWFSVFSPRMQNYTIGVDPVFKGSPAGGLTSPKASTTVALLENPAAAARGGSTTLFRQPYEYAEDAAGIERVPIPVWSTRMFTASWRTPYPPDKPPFKADLKRSKDGIITGKIINEMPVDLEDVCLIYHERWYTLPNNRVLAAKGDLFDVAELGMGGGFDKGKGIDSWFRDPILNVQRKAQNTTSTTKAWQNQGYMVPTWNEQKKVILFFRENNTGLNALNSGLRTVNQSWRLGNPYRDEVILVARTAYASGKAKQVNEEGLVQLWNDQLPGSADQCPLLTGFLNQETYIRIYIPVKNQ
jgi:hypothetical protein